MKMCSYGEELRELCECLLYSFLKCVGILSCGRSDVGGRLYLKSAEMDLKGGVGCI